jgi:hypothetical protein
MKKIRIVGLLACLIGFASTSYGQLLLQQYNATQSSVVATTAPVGERWELGGTILDLTQFSGTGNTSTENPFGWANWSNYKSVNVVGGVWQGTAEAAGPRMLTGTNAYAIDMSTYRYLELTIRKQSEVGTGIVYFRVNGNSIATSGQNGAFNITNAGTAKISTDVNTIILDMQQVAAWTGSNMTGLGLVLHSGQGDSVINTTDYLYSVRLSDSIAAIPEPTTSALLGAVALGAFLLRRRNRQKTEA